ncbi:hypothetical protein HYT25_00250 [Candidatus Pacearchaeota archaeon]|nr:hypothetical protein [Candidatus Pacearchaeota archaeon]
MGIPPQDNERKPKERTANKVTYVWAENSFFGQPLYHHFNEKRKGIDWFPITKEKYETAVREIKDLSSRGLLSKIEPDEKFPEYDGSTQFLFQGAILRLSRWSSYGLGETQNCINILTEVNSKNKGETLTTMLGLPFPSSKSL